MEKVLTVGRLIELLKDYPDDMPILSEGCDCYGEAGGVSVEKWSYTSVLTEYPETDWLLITRL